MAACREDEKADCAKEEEEVQEAKDANCPERQGCVKADDRSEDAREDYATVVASTEDYVRAEDCKTEEACAKADLKEDYATVVASKEGCATVVAELLEASVAHRCCRRCRYKQCEALVHIAADAHSKPGDSKSC